MTVALAALVGGCAGGEPGTSPTEDPVFVADPAMIEIRPNQTASARFLLTSGGVPIAAQPVTFAIPGPPDGEPEGATLLAASGVTDSSGAVSVDLRAGDVAVFQVVATAGSIQALLVVVVELATTGSVVVAPFFAPNSSAAGRTTSIEVRLLDGRLCADLELTKPLFSPRPTAALPPSGGTARYDAVSTTKTSAVVGRALSGRGVSAIGCIDLLGSSVIPEGVIQLALPLRDVVPDPVGTYAIRSPLAFAPPLAAAAVIAKPWRDLGDCPLDPAQLFLDCAIDALSPSTGADPLDCTPSSVAGGEGPLGDVLAARRGSLIVDTAGTVTSCRAAHDGSGAPSLDAIVMGLFGSPTPALVVALPAIGNDAAHVLDRVELVSALDLRSAGRPDEYLVTHTLVSARFLSSAGSADVDLLSLAIPALTAYGSATTRDDVLMLDNHGLSLRLGRAARAGFGAAALAPRGVPPDAGGLIRALGELAKYGTESACAAIDSAVCSAVGRAPLCLAVACPAGLSTLTARLDAVFDRADGTGLDLYLAGSAPLIDRTGDGVVHQLGSDMSDSTAIASWTVDLHTATGDTRLAAPFVGTRTGN